MALKPKHMLLYKKSLLTPSVIKSPGLRKSSLFSGRKLMARVMKIGMDNDTPDQQGGLRPVVTWRADVGSGSAPAARRGHGPGLPGPLMIFK